MAMAMSCCGLDYPSSTGIVTHSVVAAAGLVFSLEVTLFGNRVTRVASGACRSAVRRQGSP